MIMGTLLAVGYLVVFWVFGALIPEKFQSGKFPVMCITGFLLYYTLFEIVAFPMKYLCCSLKQLTVIWGCLLILLVLFVIWKKTESSGRQCQDNTGQYAKEYIRAYSVAGSSRSRSVAWI